MPKEAFAQLVVPVPPGEPPRSPIGQDFSAEVWIHLAGGGVGVW